MKKVIQQSKPTTVTRIRPMPGRVLVSRVEEERTQSAIVIPDVAKATENIAEVIAIGPPLPGKRSPDISPGDRVILVGNFASRTFKVDGAEYVIIDFKHALAKLTVEK